MVENLLQSKHYKLQVEHTTQVSSILSAEHRLIHEKDLSWIEPTEPVNENKNHELQIERD